jgi:ribokinase
MPETATAAPRIAVVGSTMIDLIAYTPRVPGPGETVVGDRFTMGFGGKGANQAVMARLLGAVVVMVNCVGDDEYGRSTRDNLASYGIDVGHVSNAAGSSGVAPIWVEPDGTNRIIVVPGANHALSAQEAASAIRATADVSVVVGQFEIPQPVTAAAFTAAKSLGATTVLNPAPAQTIEPALLAVTDWLIPNEVEFAFITGVEPGDQAMTTFAAETGTRLVVTLGAAGSAVVAADGSVERFPAISVEVVDTTGAGDAFVGAFAFAIACGLDVDQAVRLGNACAADSVRRPGTQTSFPDTDRCRQLIAAL